MILLQSKRMAKLVTNWSSNLKQLEIGMAGRKPTNSRNSSCYSPIPGGFLLSQKCGKNYFSARMNFIYAKGNDSLTLFDVRIAFVFILHQAQSMSTLFLVSFSIMMKLVNSGMSSI